MNTLREKRVPRAGSLQGWRPSLSLAIAAVISVSPVLSITVAPPELVVHGNSDELTISAPGLHFLTGKALDRLHDGVALPFDAQLSLFSSQSLPLQRAVDRFVFSYDLWEEKFSVTRLREPRMSSSHMTASAAETWCLESLHLPLNGISASGSVRLRLELRSEEPKEMNPILDDAGISLTGLIEIFSRPARSQQQKWTIESAPFSLADFKRS